MKEWTNPEVKELGVEETEHGTEIKTVPDFSYSDGTYTYYSFS